MQKTFVKTQSAVLTTLSLRLLVWLLLLLPTLALAAVLPTVSRVKDINTTLNSSSDPANFVKADKQYSIYLHLTTLATIRFVVDNAYRID